MDPQTNLVWIDLEMTGLNVETDVILEIASVVTDADLEVIAEGPALAIRQGERALAEMDEWCIEHHTASGLVDRVRHSKTALAEAEAATLSFVELHCPPRTAPLCGNSVWHDRRFLARYMPALESHFHYRIVDVSTVKELALRWRPQLADGYKKKNAHRALDDIRESIGELRHYREHFFAL